jgi:hypothetical protein
MKSRFFPLPVLILQCLRGEFSFSMGWCLWNRAQLDSGLGGSLDDVGPQDFEREV